MTTPGTQPTHAYAAHVPSGPPVSYRLPGDAFYVASLYPDPAKLDRKVNLPTVEAVIAFFTAQSVAQDGIALTAPPSVRRVDQGYQVTLVPQAGAEEQAKAFARAHVAFCAPERAGLAIAGAKACMNTTMWNPMAGIPVNTHDGPCEWLPCLPVGLPLVNHRAVTVMHYPPIVAYRSANYYDNMTLRRWTQLLQCVGIQQDTLYHAIVDVNPIAAPGSGQSEYPNDYFPIALTTQFYDNEAEGLTYLRSMLEGSLNPEWNAANPYTLPLLVCGSPLYDPQAVGWFRVRYRDQLPKDPATGEVPLNVLQTGFVRIDPTSEKLTPFLIANHMIAAGVTGQCTSTPNLIPNIQKYEAQDLVAATWIAQYHANPATDPAEALKVACRRWFGADNGDGAPNPPSDADKLVICALAQMDLCFDPVKIAPMWTYEQAVERCKEAGGKSYQPCFGCGKIPPTEP